MATALAVREHPTLFTGSMVRAILANLKTKTRRVIVDRNSVGNYRASELLLDDPRTFVDGGPSPAGNPGPYLHAYVNAPLIEKRRGWEPGDCDPAIMDRLYPRYQPGDRLWVKETWSAEWPEVFYRADNAGRYIDDEDQRSWLKKLYDAQRGDWRPSIFMPRWASRLTLEITEVRVERLQEVSNDDAQAEGINAPPSFAVAEFRTLWNDLNADRGYGWDANPWVWVLSFRRTS